MLYDKGIKQKVGDTMGKVDTDYLKTGYEHRGVYLINGDYRVMDIKMLVGYCHCSLHKGFLTKNLYKHHECAVKKCPFLEKFDDYETFQNAECAL